MVPMMFPGFQNYMPPMGMGMGMGMGIEMGLSRPVMPFPNVLASAPSATPAAAAHLGPRFPVPPFHVPPIPAPDPSRVQPTNQVRCSICQSGFWWDGWWIQHLFVKPSCFFIFFWFLEGRGGWC